MCYFPINIKNPNLKSNNDYRRIIVPCGKCQACITKRANHWFIRLQYEQKLSLTSHFVTLTYELSPRSYNDYPTCDKTHLQLYFKRLRKAEKGNHRIKYYATSEYGEQTERPHYHIILFNVLNEKNIDKCWNSPILQGIVSKDKVEDASIKYVTGYIGKKIGIPRNDYDDRLEEFSLMSKNMGNYYTEKILPDAEKKLKGYVSIGGVKYSMPRYYKNKMFFDTKMKHAFKTDYENGLISKEDYDASIQLLNSEAKGKQSIISKHNYELFIKNQNREAKNYPTILDYEKSLREYGENNNVKQKKLAASKAAENPVTPIKPVGLILLQQKS